MTVFDEAINTIFENEDFTVDVVYTASGSPTPITIKGLFRKPDETLKLYGAEFITEAKTLEVRQSDVPDPQEGDDIEVGGVSYQIQSKPISDGDGLVWLIPLHTPGD